MSRRAEAAPQLPRAPMSTWEDSSRKFSRIRQRVGLLLVITASLMLSCRMVSTRVLDADHPNGRRVGSRVVALIRHPDADAELYNLRVDHTTIEATGNHPFFVRGRGWVRVRDLHRGMVLEEYSGKRVHL